MEKLDSSQFLLSFSTLVALADTKVTSCSSISHHRYDPLFAAASHSIEIFDETKTSPISTLKFHSTSNSSVGEHIVNVAFNKSETNVLASSGSDRTVVLYDLRSGKALGRVAMQVRLTLIHYLSKSTC